MAKPIVSILIPVYNVENYLEKCLDSVISQTMNNIEIICVNDGSTDHSGEILEKYQKKDKRIIVVNKEMAGCLLQGMQGWKLHVENILDLLIRTII